MPPNKNDAVSAVVAKEALSMPPSRNDAVEALSAQLLVPYNDPVIPLPDTNSDPVITADPLNGNPDPPALRANEAVVAKLALGTEPTVSAKDAVPIKLPIIVPTDPSS